MILLFLFIFIGVGAATFGRKAEQIIPMGISVVMLSGYLMAVSNHLSRTVLASLSLLALCSAAMVAYSVFILKVNKKDYALKIARAYLSWGLALVIALSVLIVFLTSGHFVTNWDDFNYWANFPKNLYYRDAFVSGGALSTAYKDYLPIVQILYYTVFKSVGGYRESIMFAINNILLLVYAIPFFRNTASGKKTEIIIGVMSGILFVPSLSFQSFHCLGVDIIISMMFGYALVRIIFEKRDLFFYLDMALALSVLIMVKAAALMIVAVVAFVLLLSEKTLKNRLVSLGTIAPSFVFLLSWKVFCRVHGNVSYLTERMDGSIAQKSFAVFPYYTGVVFNNFLKQIATFNLNNGIIGATPLVCIVFCIVVYIAFSKEDLEERGKKSIFITLFAGFLIYLVFLMYTYLYVFDRWEAMSLSSFDRYISLYLLGMVYLACYMFVYELSFFTFALPVLMFVTLNFSFLISTMFPGFYQKTYEDISHSRHEVQGKLSSYFGKDAKFFGSRVLIINKEKDDELEKYQQFAVVPSVSYIMHLDYKGSNEDFELIEQQMEDHRADCAIIYETGEVIQKVE